MMQATTYNLAGNGQMPEVVEAEQASWSTLPMLGVHPVLGRLFRSQDDRPQANATIVMSWGLWKRRYGGDPSIIGRTILVDAQALHGSRRSAIVVPLSGCAHATLDAGLSRALSRNHAEFRLSQLRRSWRAASRRQQRAGQPPSLSTIQRQIRQQHPEGPVNDAVNLRPILDGQVRNVKAGLYALLAATGCLLLIACLNIANLLVARAASRGRETAIRAALGGSRVQLIRSQVIESLLLSSAGGAVGMALAYGALQWLVHVRADLPRVDAIHIDGSAALFAVACVITCGVLAGLLPALSAGDRDILRALQESSRSAGAGRSRARLRRLLLSMEVALTVVLLISAGLLLKSYRAMRDSGLGCATDNVLTMNLSQPRHMKTSAQLAAFLPGVCWSAFGKIPGVEAAAAATLLPGQGRDRDDVYTIREHPPLPKGQVLDATTLFVDPGYFQAMQIPLIAGRSFTNDERLERANKVVISQALGAREL